MKENRVAVIVSIVNGPRISGSVDKVTLYTQAIHYLEHHPTWSHYEIFLYESTSIILVFLDTDAHVLIEIKEDPQEVKIFLEARNKRTPNQNSHLLDDLEKFFKEKVQ